MSSTILDSLNVRVTTNASDEVVADIIIGGTTIGYATVVPRRDGYPSCEPAGDCLADWTSDGLRQWVESVEWSEERQDAAADEAGEEYDAPDRQEILGHIVSEIAHARKSARITG